MKQDPKPDQLTQSGSSAPPQATPPPLPPRNDPEAERLKPRRPSRAVLDKARSIGRLGPILRENLKPRRRSTEDSIPESRQPAPQVQPEAEDSDASGTNARQPFPSPPADASTPPTSTDMSDSDASMSRESLPQASDFVAKRGVSPGQGLPKLDTATASFKPVYHRRSSSLPVSTSTPGSFSTGEPSRRASDIGTYSDDDYSPDTPADHALPDAADMPPATFKKESPFGVVVKDEDAAQDSQRRNQLKANSTADTLAKYGSGME